MLDEGSNAGSLPKRQVHRVALGALAFVMVAVILFFLMRGSERPEVWSKTTVPFDPTCSENCTTAGEIGGLHGSASVEFRQNAAVDDPIAQWGDCLQTVFVCLAENVGAPASAEQKATVARTCVNASSCPAPCKDRYAKKAAGSATAAEQAFDEVFIGEGAWCLPSEAL